MTNNRDLLKEAIADAKAVKETAIANAKAALEEAFTPQLQSMFSMKLQEMEDSDLEDATKRAEKGDSTDLALHMAGIKEDDDMNDEIDLEELLRELEEEETAEGLYEAEEEEAEDVEMSDEESEEGEDKGEPLDLEDMTDEDLKDIIEDVIKDMIASGELEAGEEGEAEEGEEEVGMEDEEEVDLAELLKEIEEMERIAKNNQKPTLNIDINGTLMVAVSNLDLWVERNRCKKIMIIGSNDLVKNPNLDRFLQISSR